MNYNCAIALAEPVSLLFLKHLTYSRSCCLICLERCLPPPEMVWLAPNNLTQTLFFRRFSLISFLHRLFSLLTKRKKNILRVLLTYCLSFPMRAEIATVTREHCLEYSGSSIILVDWWLSCLLGLITSGKVNSKRQQAAQVGVWWWEHSQLRVSGYLKMNYFPVPCCKASVKSETDT